MYNNEARRYFFQESVITCYSHGNISCDKDSLYLVCLANYTVVTSTWRNILPLFSILSPPNILSYYSTWEKHQILNNTLVRVSVVLHLHGYLVLLARKTIKIWSMAFYSAWSTSIALSSLRWLVPWLYCADKSHIEWICTLRQTNVRLCNNRYLPLRRHVVKRTADEVWWTSGKGSLFLRVHDEAYIQMLENAVPYPGVLILNILQSDSKIQ